MDEVTCFAGLFALPFIVTNARRVSPLDKQTNPLPPIIITPEIRREHEPTSYRNTRDKQLESKERILVLLEYLRRNRVRQFTSMELVAGFGGSPCTMVNYLNKLRYKGFVHRSGRNGKAYYYSATSKMGETL